ncbi:hypothetical protein Mapa_000523 [Marchantia paleacea]|nr:hypothetical protein Mapa_000523 [Marchantia paleacea]
MVAWKYSRPALLRIFPRLPSILNVPASLSPTLISQLPIPRYFHSAARLEGIPKGTLPLDAYNELVKAGSIRHDLGQVAALLPLERLHMDIENYSSPSINLVSKMLSYVSIKPRRQTPRGVYIHGGVGTGKSLVADIFYHCSPIESKQRVHFHQFMLDVHKRSLYKNGLQRDLFLPCIEMIKESCHVHMFQPNAPDYRLIGAPPDGSRQQSLHSNLRSPPNSCRALSTVWHMPVNKDTAQKLEQSFAELARNRPMGPTVITEGSRTIFVPRAASGIAFFTFSEICGTRKGAADYPAIAASFHTLFVSDIPKMTRAYGDLARRSIILADVLYEQSVKLIVSADADLGALYRPRQEEEQIGPLGSVEKTESPSTCPVYEEKDEEFAFARTVSRLYHMQDDYHDVIRRIIRRHLGLHPRKLL